MKLSDQIQLEIFALASRPKAATSGRSLRDGGIKRSIDHAGNTWALRAYGFLLEFIRPLPQDRRFMTEQVRAYAYERGLAAPPSERAWGAVTMKAVRNRVIISMGFAKVSNKKAHCANAAVWRKL